jgi:P-type Ca2+ transporter type 2C
MHTPAVVAHAVNAGAMSLWQRFMALFTGKPQYTALSSDEGRDSPTGEHPGAKEDRRDTVSARFAHTSIEDTVSYFRTSLASGLSKADITSLVAQHGYNEFSVSAPEPLLLKFAKTIYESPLILLLCGSATVSAIMGNVDDAVSILVAILIVLIGALSNSNTLSVLLTLCFSRLRPRTPVGEIA